MNPHPKVVADQIDKEYWEGDKQISVLRGLCFSLQAGQKVGIVGASGSGKSTLLHILGGLDPPTAGKVFFENQDIYRWPEVQRATFRNRSVGFVFQFYHLLPELTVLENVAVPVWISGRPRKEGLQMALEALTRVGMECRGDASPTRLSGGECQRVTLARACVLQPPVILADEPTGNLDAETGRKVFDYLLEVVFQTKGSLVLVTHNRDLASQCDQVLELRDGILQKL